ncbi:MAG: sulfotransferase domain-containing protein [Pikeienuella sp.]
MKNLVWLASYPKSGNTWTRIFLANYVFNAQSPVPINEVHRLGIGDSVAKAYLMVGGPGTDLTDGPAMLKLRPRVLRGIAANGADLNFVKTHNIRDHAMGTELIPTPMTRSAVYILRDPRDVAVSYARHYDMTPEDAAAAIGRDDNTILGGPGGVPQYLGSWSRHVERWTERPPFPVLSLRYEDLQADPEAHFARLLEHIGFPVEAERLARAVRFSDFDELTRQESRSGFIEKSASSERFFHTGKAGQWRDVLSADSVAALEARHGRLMRRHGYL